jgi:hypothetical protein
VYEYHGWVSISTDTYEEDDDRRDAAVTAIRSRIAQIGEYGLLDLRNMNGHWFLHLSGMPNRAGQWAAEVVGLFSFVGDTAPGSYGLLYIRDDEAKHGHGNEFQVLRMVRGRVSEERDQLLSPCVPTLEDPEDGR